MMKQLVVTLTISDELNNLYSNKMMTFISKVPSGQKKKKKKKYIYI